MELSKGVLIFLDYFFIIFHTVLIFFNLFGWIFKATRRWNLFLLLLTIFSWVVLGFFYGWGYCFCTDWHWDVRHKLGYFDMPNSYVKFLLDLITGWDWNAKLVDGLTLGGLITAMIFSFIFNIKDFLKRKKIGN